VVLMLMTAIRYYGERNKINNFGRQALQLFGRVFLFFLLPAGILTGVLMLLARIYHWG
jgi:hypothetical protein